MIQARRKPSPLDPKLQALARPIFLTGRDAHQDDAPTSVGQVTSAPRSGSLRAPTAPDNAARSSEDVR